MRNKTNKSEIKRSQISRVSNSDCIKEKAENYQNRKLLDSVFSACDWEVFWIQRKKKSFHFDQKGYNFWRNSSHYRAQNLTRKTSSLACPIHKTLKSCSRLGCWLSHCACRCIEKEELSFQYEPNDRISQKKKPRLMNGAMKTVNGLSRTRQTCKQPPTKCIADSPLMKMPSSPQNQNQSTNIRGCRDLGYCVLDKDNSFFFYVRLIRIQPSINQKDHRYESEEDEAEMVNCTR